jgi:ribosomal protein S18 acetylase RimI-like enzyme
MDFRFTNEETLQRADEIVAYLTGPRLWIPRADYPDFDAWVARVHGQLKTEAKRALLAIAQGNIVGAVLYQRHQTAPDALEVKNITVRPDMQGRYVASFLLRNTEIEGQQDFSTSRALVDAKVQNRGIRSFLTRNGYAVRQAADLYGLGAGEDIVYEKLAPSGRASIVGS